MLRKKWGNKEWMREMLAGLSILTGFIAGGCVSDSVSVCHAETCLEEIYTYRANTPDVHREFPEVIEQEGMRYRLEGVTYEVSSVADTIGITSADLIAEEPHQPDLEIHVDDRLYRLEETKKEEWILDGRNQLVSAHQLFLDGQMIPDTITVSALDPLTGETVTGEIGRLETVSAGTDWRIGALELPVTYLNYGNEAGEYDIAGNIVTLIDDTPAFENYEHVILQVNGRDEQWNRITDIVWDGEAYLNSYGAVCRKAKATGDVLVECYRTIYQGEIRLPDLSMVRYTDYYESETQYLITARVTYQPDEEKLPIDSGEEEKEEQMKQACLSELDSLSRKNTVLAAVGGISGLMTAGCLALLMGRKHEMSQERKG
ncbi:MAG: hypothetical protein IJ468_11670 [Lachnospiraceae bacterium]|nr:hypothetical protein [Lachnospiraceae bacterium]